MTFALNQDQAALASAVAAFASHHAPRTGVRGATDQEQTSRAAWPPLTGQGLHAIHLDAAVGGQGGGLEDLAVVVAELGRNLVPGAFLPTVVASSIAGASTGPGADKAVRRFADGSLGAATWTAPTLTGELVHGAWAIEGRLPATLGLVGADILVVNADCGGVERWFAVDARAAGVTVQPLDGVDLTRSLATATFANVSVAPDDELGAMTRADASALALALVAVEASGVIAWCYETTVDHLRTRHQFGRPIGSFQALQHRAAQLCITSELATAAAWDAVRSLSEDHHQRALGVGAGSLVATGRAVHAAVEALSMHGAIGFSWEHDLHLYWRRAISLAAVAGPSAETARALGEAALRGPRTFELDVEDANPVFRAKVGEILDRAAALSNSERSPLGDTDTVARGDRRNLLAEEGLVSAHLPSPYGLGADATEQLIVRRELAVRGLQEPSMAIGEWVIPVILSRGTPQQIDRVVGPSLRGELLWCQLFSEPGAGSDMAAVALKATPTDGGWLLSGQKIWTTLAHVADWGLCLARTGTEGKKHLGLSMFLIDMSAPGIEVRPIKQANGAAEFNEVFFEDVFVPAEMLVGQPGDGWSLMIETISQERLFIGTFAETGHEKRIRELIRDRAYAGSPEGAFQALGEVSADGAAIAAMNMRETLRRIDGNPPGASVSIAKAAAAQLHTKAAAAALDLVGAAAVLHEKTCEPVFNELDIPTWIVGGGTLEIQLNAIASFVIGLPRG